MYSHDFEPLPDGSRRCACSPWTYALGAALLVVATLAIAALVLSRTGNWATAQAATEAAVAEVTDVVTATLAQRKHVQYYASAGGAAPPLSVGNAVAASAGTLGRLVGHLDIAAGRITTVLTLNLPLAAAAAKGGATLQVWAMVYDKATLAFRHAEGSPLTLPPVASGGGASASAASVPSEFTSADVFAVAVLLHATDTSPYWLVPTM